MVRFDFLSGIVLFFVFGGAFLYARGFTPVAAPYPYLINILGMFLSAILVLASLVKMLKGKTESIKKFSREVWVRVGVTTAAVIIYSILLGVIGYILSTALFGFGMILYLYLGKRTKKYIIFTLIISVGLALILYFVFRRLLYVWLP